MAFTPTAPHRLLTALAAAHRRGEASPVAATEVGDLRATKTVEKAFRAGARLGPIHGPPFALNGLIDFEDRVFAAGSPPFGGRISSASAVARRRPDAGGMPPGKATTVAMIFGRRGANPAMPPPLNPEVAAGRAVCAAFESASGPAPRPDLG